MKPRESSFFWTSYTDLMTSLFFVMLALYVLTVAILKYQQKATEEELKKIKEIQNATQQLPREYFQYQKEYKRFTLIRKDYEVPVQFAAGSAKIPSQDYLYLIKVGRSIQRLVDDLKIKFPKDNIKYLIVIEGMASKDNFINNYQLSYERALSLLQFWRAAQISLDPDVCEIIIAGSGVEGVGRFTGQTSEYKNQRFLIQIIPKIGEIK